MSALTAAFAAVGLLLFLLGKAGSHWMAPIAIFTVGVQVVLAAKLNGPVSELLAVASVLFLVCWLAYMAGHRFR